MGKLIGNGEILAGQASPGGAAAGDVVDAEFRDVGDRKP
jgi:hypothetical protein